MPPSDKHNELADKSLKWLGARTTKRGMRGATEVYLGHHYVADAVAMCRFADRYARRYHVSSDAVCIFEVKVSRADFLSTFGPKSDGSRLVPRGTLHWIVAPKDLISVEELPPFWGLLCPSVSGLAERSRPLDLPMTQYLRNAVAYSLLWKPRGATRFT